MRLLQLIERLHQQLPKASDRHVACLAMLLCDRDPQFKTLESQEEFLGLLDEIQLRLQSIDDQHAAVAYELDQLALTQPCEFEPKHVWTLIRAIKVQSQFVDMLTGVRVEQMSRCTP
jgi:hypothetical protein